MERMAGTGPRMREARLRRKGANVAPKLARSRRSDRYGCFFTPPPPLASRGGRVADASSAHRLLGCRARWACPSRADLEGAGARRPAERRCDRAPGVREPDRLRSHGEVSRAGLADPAA